MLGFLPWKTKRYRGKFWRINIDGYSYGFLFFYGRKYRIFFRWKSYLPDVEYIEPDSGICLTENDIKFEICSELPKQVVSYYIDNCGLRAEDINCNKWQDVLQDEKYYPKPSKIILEEKEKVEVILNKPNDYPDVFFKLFFNETVTEKHLESAEEIFEKIKNMYNKSRSIEIHDVFMLGNFMNRCDEKSTIIGIDYGNCSMSALNKTIKYLEKYGGNILGIEKIEIN